MVRRIYAILLGGNSCCYGQDGWGIGVIRNSVFYFGYIARNLRILGCNGAIEVHARYSILHVGVGGPICLSGNLSYSPIALRSVNIVAAHQLAIGGVQYGIPEIFGFCSGASLPQ